VLFEYRTPVGYAVLGPVAEAIAALPNIRVFFTSEYPERMRALPAGRFLTHREAEWRHFDVYVNADPWAAVRLRRCAHRVNFFHGVAGKYDLDNPAHLPMGFERYDRIAFINADRMHRYLEAGVVTPAQAALVGYPKLDRLATGGYNRSEILGGLGLDPSRPTILYGPTYSSASSLHIAGEAIVTALADAGFNVLVKLHDRSLDPDRRYNDGIDWGRRMRRLERPGRVRLALTGDSSPLLAAADAMVTDHSSIGFEFLVLDRPLLVFDAPELPRAARISPDKIAALRSVAAVASDVPSLVGRAATELAAPDRRSPARKALAREMFFDPGRATARAVALIRPLLAGPGAVRARVSSSTVSVQDGAR
jgi:hypothetical protein